MVYHVPALLEESIDGLNLRSGGIYVDVTFGGGGHSAEILKRLKRGKVIAFDLDEDAEANIPDDNRLIFLHQNFRYLKNNLRSLGIDSVDGIIADLGVSFHQFDDPGRGFTFRQNAPLDMRMNRKNPVTAANLLEKISEEDLADILYHFGELTDSRRIAKALIVYRSEKPIITAGDVTAAIEKFAPHRQEHKFYAKVFQALRIYVNREMDNLKEMLEQTLSVLKSGGRLVVITYHSIEDRIVKNFLRSGNFSGELIKDIYGNSAAPFRLINRKVIVPGVEEISINNRARSARLRIAEKIQL
jgi:16S rRNA (cytosine1402-N4)-methyltransferase